jgi:hypothetical protein
MDACVSSSAFHLWHRTAVTPDAIKEWSLISAADLGTLSSDLKRMTSFPYGASFGFKRGNSGLAFAKDRKA